MYDQNGLSLCDYIDAEKKVNKSHYISGGQWDRLAVALKRGKTDEQIKAMLKRPDLDMNYFREMDRRLGVEIEACFSKA